MHTGDTPMKNASKDFAAIADDYGFFMAHSTEAENDVLDYQTYLERFVACDSVIRMLDFGCGAGDFTDRLLERIRWSPDRLQLTLVEPVANQRCQASERLKRFTTSPIEQGPELRATDVEGFDIILANHVFYYVTDLNATLAKLVGALHPDGLFLVAIAGRDNAMLRFCEKGFAYLGQPVPYWLAEDFEAALNKLGVSYTKEHSRYELIFPDSNRNRMKILRFLCADHLSSMPEQELLTLFDSFALNDRIEMHTHSMHFMIRATTH